MHRQHFTQLCSLLEQHKLFWSTEVIEQYPRCLYSGAEGYPEDWLEDILRLDYGSRYLLERQLDVSQLQSTSLIEFIGTYAAASRLPHAEHAKDAKLDDYAFVKVKAKKRHEIESLTGLIAQLHQERRLDGVLDFGGGVGYLAQALAHYHHIPTVSIDADQTLQETGARRRHRHPSAVAPQVDYWNTDVAEVSTQLTERALQHRLFFGLHTCGALANHQLRTAVAACAPVLLNFGCCYYKMASEEHFISEFGKQASLRFSPQALTLATRSPRPTPEAFDSSKRVKFFRYLIHLYLYHEAGITEFVPLGSSHRRLYTESFAEYAAAQLPRVGLDPNEHTPDRLQAFASAPHFQDLANRMLAANVVRSFTARAIEVALLLDRAIYLEEHGYQTDLAEYFDPILSPRNIGIRAVLPESDRARKS